MKTPMISTGNKVSGTTNNSEICCPLILEMATFQLEVRKKNRCDFFFSLSSSQTPLLLDIDLCRSLGPK